jgi:Zn-dependent protease
MLTLYLGVSLLIATDVREYARAVAATRLHDPTPRLWGRLTLNPRAWFDPFGSGLLPGLILILWAAQAFLTPVVAYGKPAPVDPSYFRRYKRDSVIVGLAGPVANLVLAVIALLLLRVPFPAEAARIVAAFAVVNLFQAFFHLLPIPGLDGARLVGLVLPPRAAEVYRNADAYLALFVLVIIFLLAGPVHSIVFGLTNAVCSTVAGFTCV